MCPPWLRLFVDDGGVQRCFHHLRQKFVSWVKYSMGRLGTQCSAHTIDLPHPKDLHVARLQAHLGHLGINLGHNSRLALRRSRHCEHEPQCFSLQCFSLHDDK